jgi:hypothetical protein
VASKNTYGIARCPSGRVRNTATSSSMPLQILDTVDFEIPDSHPSARTRSSIFRVEVPVMYAVMITAHNA